MLLTAAQAFVSTDAQSSPPPITGEGGDHPLSLSLRMDAVPDPPATGVVFATVSSEHGGLYVWTAKTGTPGIVFSPPSGTVTVVPGSSATFPIDVAYTDWGTTAFQVNVDPVPGNGAGSDVREGWITTDPLTGNHFTMHGPYREPGDFIDTAHWSPVMPPVFAPNDFAGIPPEPVYPWEASWSGDVSDHLSAPMLPMLPPLEPVPSRPAGVGGLSAPPRGNLAHVSAAANLDAGEFTISGCWRYEDEGFKTEPNRGFLEPGASHPQRWATVWAFDRDDNADDYLGKALTGPDGCFTTEPLPLESPGEHKTQDPYLVACTCNSWLHVEGTYLAPITGLPGVSPPYMFPSEYYYPDIGDWFDLHPEWNRNFPLGTIDAQNTTNAGATRVFEHLNKGLAYAQLGFGADATSLQIDARWPFVYANEEAAFACVPGSPCDPEEHVWGWYGMGFHESLQDKPDVLLHELGHWEMARAYGHDWWCKDPCNPMADHSPRQDDERLDIAFTEGFANFFGAWVNFYMEWEQVARQTDGGGRSYRDTLYSRWYPEKGGWSIDLEDRGKGGWNMWGERSEVSVAMALWDWNDFEGALYPDGKGPDHFDRWAQGGWGAMWDVLTDCSPHGSLRDFYDGPCSIKSSGYPLCTFNRNLWQFDPGNQEDPSVVPTQGNFDQGYMVDYNVPPGVTFRTQTDHQWESGKMNITLDLLDEERCNDAFVTLDVHINSAADCSHLTKIVDVGTVHRKRFHAEFDTVGKIPDGSNYWVCVLSYDGMEWGDGWASSPASFGVDNHSPSGSTSASAGPANASAYFIHWQAADGGAGLTGSLTVEETATCMVASCPAAPLVVQYGTWVTVCEAPVVGPSASGACGIDPIPGVEYCYRLHVQDEAGNEVWSDEDACTTVVPKIPTNLQTP